MKKLLLFLLIFAIFLTGCSTPTADEGTTPPTADDGNETPDNSDSNGDTENKPPFSIKYPESEPEKKPPAVPITNKNDPQDETADFLYVFDLKYGEFVRGANITLVVETINNMETIYSWYGSSSALYPLVQLYTTVNGERYTIAPKSHVLTGDSGPQEIKPGDSKTGEYFLTIPEDAPLGEYTLSITHLSYILDGKTTEFEGYFTLTQ